MASTEPTRAEHLEWCKQRARVYLDMNEPSQAVASFMSDVGKHAETRSITENQMFAMMALSAALSTPDARRFVEGFN